MNAEGGADLRATTRARYESALKVHLLPTFGLSPLSAITPLGVAKAVGRWKVSQSPATVRTNYVVLRAILNAAVDFDVIVKSPCRTKVVKLPALKRKERRPLTMADLARIADAMPARYTPLVYLGGVLGLRWSEAAALRE